MHRSGLALVVLLVACGGSEFSPDTGSASGAGGASGTSVTSGSGGDSSSSVSTATSVVATGPGGSTGTSSSASGGSTGAGGIGVTSSTLAVGGSAGTTGTGGSGGGSGTGGSGGGSSDAGAQDAGSVNCPALANEIAQKLAAAQVCNPNDPVTPQCQDVVEGLCCHVPVASKDSAATRAYLAALAKFMDYKCGIGCPAIPCSMAPAVCKAGPDMGGQYTCQRSP
jgi:hypothetical protein